MKTAPALLIRVLLSTYLPLAVIAAAQAAEPLVTFTESRGCRIVGSATSVARLKEIAAQGSVTWDGKCSNGLIDGPGALRHQGVVRENERNRRYAFYLTGSATAGRRHGTWSRETFNMFEDSARYWTSLATIDYVDGVSKGSPKLQTVRSDADFTRAFQQLLLDTDRQLAARNNTQQPDSGLKIASKPGDPEPVPALVAGASATSGVRAEGPSDARRTAAVDLAMRLRETPAEAPPARIAAPTRPAAATRPEAPPLALLREATPPVFGSLKPPAGSGLRPPASAVQPAQPQIYEQVAGCSVDLINGKPANAGLNISAVGKPLQVAGWAADPRDASLPEKAWIQVSSPTLASNLIVSLLRTVDRPDVARAMGDQAYARSGFDMQLGTETLPAGDYTVSIIQQTGADFLICQSIPDVSIR